MDEQLKAKGPGSGKKNKKKNKKSGAASGGDGYHSEDLTPIQGASAQSPSAGPPGGKRGLLPKPDMQQFVVNAYGGHRSVSHLQYPHSSQQTRRGSSGGDNRNMDARPGSGRPYRNSEGAEVDRNTSARAGGSESYSANNKASQGSKNRREKAKAERNYLRKGDKYKAEDQQKYESLSSKEQSSGKGKFTALEGKELLRELAEHRIFELRKKNLSFPNAYYFCRLCEYHLDRPRDCENHVNERRHQRKKEALDLEGILENVPDPSLPQVRALDAVVDSIVEQDGLSPSALQARRDAAHRLQAFIDMHKKDVTLRLYGSSLTGFGAKESDVNIEVAGNGPTPSLLIDVYNILHEKGEPEFINTQSDFNAKIPVVRLTDTKTGLPIVLAINSQQAVLTSSLLQLYSLADPRVQPLAVTLRNWARICHLDRQDEGTLPPFGYNIMVIYFLQQVSPPVLCLLPVPKTQSHVDTPKGTVPRKMEDIVDFDSLKDKAENWKSENKSSAGELWLKLLKFYCLDFDNTHFVISILQSEPLTRQEKKWHSKKLAIEDPFAAKKNVANSMANALIFEYYQSCMRKAYEYFGMPRDKDGNITVSVSALRALASKKTDSLLKENEAASSSSSATSQESPQKEIGVNQGVKKKVEGKKKGDDSGSDSNEEPVIIKPNQSIAQRLKLATGESTSQKTVPKSPEGSDSEGATEASSVSDLTADSAAALSASELDVTSDSVSGFSTSDCYVTASEMEVTADSVADSSVQDVSDGYRNTSEISEVDTTKEEASSDDEEYKTSPNTPSELAEPDAHQFEHLHITDQEDAGLGPSRNGKENLVENDDGEEDSDAYSYVFSEDVFTGGKGPAVICGYCEQEGHIKANCPEDKLPPVNPLPPLSPAHLELMNGVVSQIICDFSPNEIQMQKRERVVKDLEHFIRQIYPDANFALFGSSCNGFGFYQSDLDICMTLRGKTVEDIDVVEIIETVAKKLMQRRNLYNVISIPTAKVPIVKFTDRESRLEGDISLYNTLAQRNTRLLRCYSEIDPRVRILGYAVKVFAKVCYIGDASRGSLSSYGYILMMIHYLQQCRPPVIPVLQELRPEGEWPEHIVEGCNTWFFDDLRNLRNVWPHYGKNTESPGQLWLGFLRYYLEEFDWKGMVVSIRQSPKLTKFEKMWTGKTIAVEDPFDQTHNLGGGLSRKMNNFIYKTFVNGRIHFGTPIEYRVQLYQRYRNPSDFFFDVELLTDGKPPNDRGCRMCGKIGHLVKDCPNRSGNRKRQQTRKDTEGKDKTAQTESSHKKKDSKGREGKGQGKDVKGQDKEAKGQGSVKTKEQEEQSLQGKATTKSEEKSKAEDGSQTKAAVPDKGQGNGRAKGQGHSKQAPLSKDGGDSDISAGATVVPRIDLGPAARTTSAAKMSGPSTTTITTATSTSSTVTTSTSSGSSPRVPPGFSSKPERLRSQSDEQYQFGGPDPPPGLQTSTPIRSAKPGMHPPGVQMDVQQLFSMVQQSGGSPTSLTSGKSSSLQVLTPEQQVAMLGGKSAPPGLHPSGNPQGSAGFSQRGGGASDAKMTPVSLMSLLQSQPTGSEAQQAGGSSQVRMPLPVKSLFQGGGSPGRGGLEVGGYSPQQRTQQAPVSQSQQLLFQQQQYLQQQQLMKLMQMMQQGQGQQPPAPSQHSATNPAPHHTHSTSSASQSHQSASPHHQPSSFPTQHSQSQSRISQPMGSYQSQPMGSQQQPMLTPQQQQMEYMQQHHQILRQQQLAATMASAAGAPLFGQPQPGVYGQQPGVAGFPLFQMGPGSQSPRRDGNNSSTDSAGAGSPHGNS
ncbi:terminal uridylyltransferase 7-like isoform X2 [Littorina saxatilis]|uniref:CCHC-type domain-containing protein n=1 Tax=Littorina saxatilis TaxID=31220 RepID=A0AAN9GB93_9CAEN